MENGRFLINLEDIKGNSALNLLEQYKGKNPYIKKLQREYLKDRAKLTETQVKYVIDNYEKEPILINRVVSITKYLGEELQKQDELKFVPERILIEYILADSEKSFHVYGKLKQNQVESKMYFIPKTQILEDPYFAPCNVEVDFTRYNEILALVGKKLYIHQKEGVPFLLCRNGCILADDMGLGKSMQAIIAALESGAQKILVICPASVKINWKREINMFCDDVVIINSGKSESWKTAKFTIINYDILKNFHTLTTAKPKKDGEVLPPPIRNIVDAGFDLLIVDEAHMLKNNKSIRGEIVAELSTKFNVPKVWLLTGTPISNRPMDFFNLLKIIKSPLAQNWQYFTTRYCDGRKIFLTLKNGKKKQVWLTDGASNLDELAVKIKNNLLRRLKKDVLDLPDKIITPVYHQLSAKALKEYDQIWDAYLIKRKELKKRGPINKDLVELGLLRQFIAQQAIPETIEMAENAIEMGKKVIIFTTYQEELDKLVEHFGKKCVVHCGPMSDTARQLSVDQFQDNPKVTVFIGNVLSAGVGITLTKGTVVIFNSFDWVPGNNEQAEDRAYRIGQDELVNVYYQLFEDTISIRILDSIRIKKNNISTIMGEAFISDEEYLERMMDQLLQDE